MNFKKLQQAANMAETTNMQTFWLLFRQERYTKSFIYGDIMVKAKLTPIILCCICTIFLILATITGCAKKEKIIQVVPGRSIAGVELGISEEQVIFILGEPNSQFSKEEMDKFGGVYAVTPEGKSDKVPVKEMEQMKLFRYLKPPLDILINENNKVERLSLSYCENVFVKDYPFLKFKYLTQQKLQSLGEPSSKMRMRQSEEKMMSMAPKGTILEYYEYFYDEIGLNIGFVFDRTKQKISEYFMGVNHIDIYSTQK